MAYGVTLTAPTITGTHTDMPVLITEDDLPSDAYNSANQIDNGGGNLVAYTDSTKTTQLPIEVVSFVTGASPSIEVWVKRTMATGNTIYLEADTVQTAQPAVTSTYGRNAVWSDYEYVYHFSDTVASAVLVDSTGNGNDADLTVGTGVTSVSGKIGDAWDFTSGDYADLDSATYNHNDLEDLDRTFGLWATASADSDCVFSLDDVNASGNPQALMTTGSGNYRFYDGGAYINGSAYSSSVDTHLAITHVGSSGVNEFFQDSVSQGTNTNSDTRFASGTAHALWLSSGFPSAGSGVGRISNFYLRASVLSDDWITTEYNNQNTATWFSNSGWSDSGGGSTDNLLADDVSSNSEVTSPAITQTHGLLSVSVESLSELSSPAITQTHALLSVSVESLSELTLPALATPDVLTADDVETTSELTTPQIAQVHNILGDDVQSLTELSSPALGQVHSLTSVSVESASELTAPVLFQPSEDVLLADDVESLTELSTPSLREGLGPIVQGSGNWFIGTNGRYYVNKI